MNGQKAYEAYANHQGWKSQSGDPLPTWADVVPENKVAWNDFAEAAGSDIPVERAYNEYYLGATEGNALSGGPAPAFAFFRFNRPTITAAWHAAWAAARS